MPALTQESVLKSVVPAVATLMPGQLGNSEFVDPSIGVADALISMRSFIAWLGLAAITAKRHADVVTLPEPADRIVERAARAMKALLKLQRPSECIDLTPRDCPRDGWN